MSAPTKAARPSRPDHRARPTVLQLLPGLVAGGAERGAVDVAAALVQAGWRALVASSGGPMEAELRRVGAEHVRLPLATKNPFGIRLNAGRLTRLVRTERVDLIHARSRAPAWSGLAAARATAVPFVTTFHAAYGFRGDWKRRYNAVMAKGDRVIAISRFIADHVRTSYGVTEPRLVTIARGIDLWKFDPARVSGERMERLVRSWRLPDDARIVLMPARLTRLKGHAVLIEALASLPVPDVCAVLIGADAGTRRYRLELEALIRRRGLEGRVRILGDCPDMPAAYALASVVVCPSTVPEGFGRVAVEAQAMGRPVVASDLGGFQETITPGRTGWLAPAGDAAAFARAIGEALALSEEARADLAYEARLNVFENYQRDRMCAETLDVYRALLHLPPGPAP